MSTAFNKTGQRQTKFSAPSVTTAVTAYTVPTTGKGETLQAVNIAANGASTVSVMINDGSTDYYLLHTYTSTANSTETYSFGEPFLLPGWAIKVQTNSANSTTFTITLEQVFQG